MPAVIGELSASPTANNKNPDVSNPVCPALKTSRLAGEIKPAAKRQPLKPKREAAKLKTATPVSIQIA